MKPSSRRAFVRQMAGGVAGVPALAALMGVRRAFAERVDRLDLPSRTAESMPQLAGEYLLSPEVTYLNHASIGTIPRAVVEARARYLEICETNPWLYMWGGAWEEPRETVRGQAAALMRCDASEVTFTHNTTEAFNLLANGLPYGRGDEVVFSSLNHDGASVAWFHAARERGYDVRRFQFPVLDVAELTDDDVLDIYDRHLTANTKVLVLPHVDNMIGLRHPIRRLADHARTKGVEVVAVDAAQTVGMIPIDLRAWGVDVYATSPHKWLQAPKGLGLTYVNADLHARLRPMWVTWGQNRWAGTARIYEDYGTRNLAEVLTLGDAITFQSRISDTERDRRLRRLWEFTQEMTERYSARWRSPRSWGQSGSLYAVEIRGKQSSQLGPALFRDHGIVFRAFSSQGLNTLRMSPNTFNTEEEIEGLFQAARA